MTAHDSSLARRLSGPWQRRGSLFIPPTVPQRHGEMENIKAYVKYSEFGGGEPTLDDFIGRLRDVGLRSLLFSLSRVMTILHNDGVSRMELQSLLRDQALTPDMLTRLRRLKNWRERIIFFPQQILFTAKMALLHSPDRDEERAEAEFRDVLVELLLMAADFLDRLDLSGDRRELECVLIAHQVRNYLMNMTEQIRYMVPRASLLYLKLPLTPEFLRTPDFIDLPAVFQAATGFNLKDYLAFGFALLVWFINQSYLRDTYREEHASINPHTFFSTSTIDPALAHRLLEGFVHTHASAKAAFEARAGDVSRLTYDFLPFMAKPLYQIRGDIIVPMHLGYLEARFTNGIYWTIFDHLQGEHRRKFTRFFGRIFEAYIRRSFQRSMPDEPGLARRVFPEFTYPTSHGERKTSDLVLLYPRTAIFLEATASRIRLEATAISGDLTAFEADVAKVILENARQLTHRIRDFRSGLYTFDGVTGHDIERIYPVIVTVHSVPESTIIWDHMRTMLADRELLSDPGVEPLQLIDVEEVEILETIFQQGVSLLQVIEARAADPERRNIGLKNFLIARFQAGANEFLRAEYQEIGDHARRLLFGVADEKIEKMG